MDPLIAQVRDCYGRVAYSHKAHEKSADILTSRLALVKNTQIALSAMVTGSLIAAIAQNETWAKVAGAALSSVLLILNTYLKSYDLGALAQRHAATATKLWAVRESFLSLLTDITSGSVATTKITQRRDRLNRRLLQIYQNAPRQPTKAYRAAQTALQINEELSFSDAEIDKLLPPPLRLQKKEEGGPQG